MEGAHEGHMQDMEHSHYHDKLGQISTSLGLDFFIIIMRQLDHMQFMLPSSSDILRFDESTLHLCLKRFFRITSKRKLKRQPSPGQLWRYSVSLLHVRADESTKADGG